MTDEIKFARLTTLLPESKVDLEMFIMRIKMEGQESWLILNVKKVYSS